MKRSSAESLATDIVSTLAAASIVDASPYSAAIAMRVTPDGIPLVRLTASVVERRGQSNIFLGMSVACMANRMGPIYLEYPGQAPVFPARRAIVCNGQLCDGFLIDAVCRDLQLEAEAMFRQWHQKLLLQWGSGDMWLREIAAVDVEALLSRKSGCIGVMDSPQFSQFPDEAVPSLTPCSDEFILAILGASAWRRELGLGDHEVLALASTAVEVWLRSLPSEFDA